MSNHNYLFSKSALLVTTLILAFPASVLANPASVASLKNAGAIVEKHDTNGKLSLIGSNSPQGIKLPTNLTSQASSPAEKAKAFIRAFAPLFGVENPDSELVVKKLFALDSKPTVKYQQLYNKIPVIGGEINVTLDGEGNLLTMSGEAGVDLKKVKTIAQVSANQATKTALKVVEREYDLTPAQVNTTTPQLNIFAPGILEPGNAPARLVWLIEVTPKAVQPVKQLVLVDAVEPDTLVRTWNNAPDARNRQTYDANNGFRLPGTLVCSETSTNANCAPTGTSDSAKAHTYAADTYDFYFNNNGRDGIDDLGSAIISSVNYSLPLTCPNAFWDGKQMVYCDGLAQADDVVGHELTHGVTQYTSNLYYYYQSGAINESLSDVFGEFIDLTNGKGNDTAAARWKVGEDVPFNLFNGPIRDMKNPPAFENPDKMTSTFYYTGVEDNGGVHYNSGVNNKAAFLMVDGGTFNGQTIIGLGIPKVEQIYYNVQTTLLSSGSGYKDLSNYLNQSCQSLIGSFGITANDCIQVKNATLAVEMDLEPIPGFQPQADFCPANQNPNNVFFDDFEGATQWNFINLVGANSWRVRTGYAASGTHMLFVKDAGTTTDSVAVQKTGVTIPAGAFLHFKHAFEFQSSNTGNPDGGILEYSVGNSNTWNDAKSLFSAGQNYNGKIVNVDAFTKISHGYVSSRYDLSSLAGQSVKFRFRQANDKSVGAPGWVVDDVRIYTCQ